MLPVFTTPLAFLGLLTLPALTAIYLLHNRSRPVPVSSLLLWTEARVVPEGGRRVERLRPPLLFWLELLLLLLLVVAAAGPHLPATGARPLVVVLDDSFSMQAGDPDSPRRRAADALSEELRRAPRGSVRLVLAGEYPQLLGEGTHRSSEVEPLLSKWTCRAAAARLDAAIALGLELGGDLATVLVLTDRAPDPPPDSGRIRWWAFGRAGPNVAIVNASRTPGPRGDRLLLEIANLAADARTTRLRVDSMNPARELHGAELRLNSHEIHRTVLELPADDASPPSPVRVSIGDDDLPFDNAVTLVPVGKRAVSYEVRIGDAKLRSVLTRAARAAGGILPSGTPPALVFVDGETEVPAGIGTWVVRILAEPDAETFTGPFVLDRAHPLTDGLSLTGVVWGGGRSPLPGSPVVMAGNVVLIADSESPTGRHDVRLRLHHDLSTLTESPAWPTLVWNLLHWRAAHLPGLDRANVRVDEEVTWTLTDSPESVEMARPGGDNERIPVNARRAVVRADRPGLYTLRAGAASVSFAANPLARDESDLTARSSGRWGEEIDATTLRLEYRDVSWMLILLAAAVAVLHLWFASRAPGPGGRR